MPKLVKDYSKSVIYRIVARDTSITDEYIGSTTNLTKRKTSHKSDCSNQNGPRYMHPIYIFIREHGGFDAWDIVLLEKYPTTTLDLLLARERYWIETKKPTLNVVHSVLPRTISEPITEIPDSQSTCPCCRHSLPPSSYDVRKNGSPKSTCRNCLSAFRAKYAAKAVPFTVRDAKKVRSELMTAIFLTNDPQTLSSILEFACTAIESQVKRLAEPATGSNCSPNAF